MTTVEDEVLHATRERPRRRGEQEVRYLHRLLVAANGVSEFRWGRMSHAAQEWVVEGVICVKLRQPLPPLPLPKETQVAKRAKPPKGSSRKWASNHVRRIVCEHPDWDKTQVEEAARKAGCGLSGGTVNVVFYDVHSVLDILKELGRLKRV